MAAKLYPCVPVDWLWMPKPVRKVVGYVTMVLFAWTFFSPLLFIVLLVPAVWRSCPIMAGSCLALLILSFVTPQKEW